MNNEQSIQTLTLNKKEYLRYLFEFLNKDKEGYQLYQHFLFTSDTVKKNLFSLNLQEIAKDFETLFITAFTIYFMDTNIYEWCITNICSQNKEKDWGIFLEKSKADCRKSLESYKKRKNMFMINLKSKIYEIEETL